MLRYLTRRLGYYVLLIAVAGFLSYLLAAKALNPRANFEGHSPRPPASAVDAQLDELNMNDHTPVLERFGTWSSHALTGDFGRTIDDTSVNAEFGRRVGVSLRLLIAGTLIGTVLGVLAGFWGAVRQYRPSDRIVTLLSFLVLSTPMFLLAVLLKLGAIKFNQATGTNVVKFTGEDTPDLHGGVLTHLGDAATHLLVPTIAIALVGIATYGRYQRSTMLDVLGSNYIVCARAKGLTRRKALLKYGLRAALIPMSTFFAYNFLAIFTSFIFTEKIFGWNGVNSWLIDSINFNDVNSVAAISVFAAVVVLFAGFLADVLHAVLDPRVRH